MKKLSLTEFADFCKKECPQKISYLSECQPWNQDHEYIRFKIVFEKIIVSPESEAICIKTSNSFMCFDRVKYLIRCGNGTIIGEEFLIICEGYNLGEIHHTLIIK